MKNILTIDVEDYFMVSGFEKVVGRSDWESFESRVERNTHKILDTIDSAASRREETEAPARPIRGTFFCLGWVGRRYPHLIREIHARGHEIASHSYEHRMIFSMSPEEFREDVRKTKAILEDASGREVVGFRAPSYSITEKTLWALEILAEEGYEYDSSIFPVHHDRYGIPDAPRFPYIVFKAGERNFEFIPLRPEERSMKGPEKRNGKNSPGLLVRSGLDEAPAGARAMIEFPLSTLRLFGQNLPVAGGGYFRLLPSFATQWAAGRISGQEGLPFIFYLHPWEVDPDQPRVSGLSLLSGFRHYLNLAKTEGRLRDLLRKFPFFSFRDFLALHKA
jgi:polysaccharide deacetylase family protein (PEP-CTERM system associated)